MSPDIADALDSKGIILLGWGKDGCKWFYWAGLAGLWFFGPKWNVSTGPLLAMFLQSSWRMFLYWPAAPCAPIPGEVGIWGALKGNLPNPQPPPAPSLLSQLPLTCVVVALLLLAENTLRVEPPHELGSRPSSSAPTHLGGSSVLYPSSF